MLELDLLKKSTAVNLAHEQLEQALCDRDLAEETVGIVLGRRTATITLQGALGALTSARHGIESSRQQLHLRQAELEQSQLAYRELQAKAEGLERLIAKQRETHRLDTLREQQHALDEATGRRWRAATISVEESGASPAGNRLEETGQ